MSNLAELPADIYRVLLEGGAPVEAVKEAIMSVGTGAANRFKSQLDKAEGSTARLPGKLYASEIGHPCIRKLWYTFHAQHAAEPLSGQTKFKFLYGDMLEAMVLPLAKLAGHSVTDEGRRVEWAIPHTVRGAVWKLVGKIDAIIDGHVVDVKSMASPSFDKYTTKPLAEADTFGYRAQLGAYHGLLGGPNPALLCVDKQLGKMAVVVDTTPVSPGAIERQAGILVDTVVRSTEPARMPNATRPESYGNEALGTVCSYCAFKHHCWRDANGGKGLAGYLYAKGPVWLSNQQKAPNVIAIPSFVPSPVAAAA